MARPPKRTPARKPNRKKKKKKERKRDLAKEYRAMVSKGDGVKEVLTLSDDDCVANVRNWISTGSLALDRTLAGRGIPCGRLTEVYGPAGIGKSTVLDHIFAQAQALGGEAVLADADTGRDPVYTSKIGVDMDKLHYLEFDEDKRTVEHLIEAAADTIKFWKKEAPDTPVVFGWDALGNTSTIEEMGKKMTEKTTASAAKVLHAMRRRLAPILTRSNVALVVLNHEYANISFGAGVTSKRTYGGDGIRSFASVRLKLHSVKQGWIESGGRTIGRRVGFELTKFKLGDPFGTGQFALLSGSGIDNTDELWNFLQTKGIIEVKGSWGGVNVDGEVTKFQGRDAFRQTCTSNLAFFQKLVRIYRSLS